MIGKDFDAVTKADIEAVVQNKTGEARTIEYKADLPGDTDEAKQEFLADVSSFANASGGDILYGIQTNKDGIPTDAAGLGCAADPAILRLENIVRDGIDPRIVGFRIKPVEGFGKGPILLLRIPRTWNGPHMVTYKNRSRFYTRNSAGKHQMDVSEIRAAFTLSQSLADKIRRFRDDRLGKIVGGNTPVRLIDGAKLILHVVPFISFSPEFVLDVASIRERGGELHPIGSSGHNSVYNFDGLLTYSTSVSKAAESYCQVFRTGIVESVWAELAHASPADGTPGIPSRRYEDDVITALTRYTGVLQSLEVPCPVVCMLCMVGVQGCLLFVAARFMMRGINPIDRNEIILPEIILNDYSSVRDRASTARVLRPAFDAVWNAAGLARSLNFDDKGDWDPRG